MVPPSLNQAQIDELKSELPEWKIANLDGSRSLQRTFTFDNFAQALEFTIRIGDIAEEQKHYPKLMIEHDRVTVYWWTDKIGSLQRNDFIMAARTDHLYEQVNAIRKARRKK